MEKRRDGSEFDFFPVSADAVKWTRYNTQQLARHPTNSSHNPPYFPAGGHVHGTPSPGERRKIECALSAHPPNLPTFQWAGPGRGPPRSDPEICDAGLEDWATTGHGRSTAFLTLSYLPFSPTSLPQYFLTLVLCQTAPSALTSNLLATRTINRHQTHLSALMLLGDSTARLCLPLARRAITSTATTRDYRSHLTIISVDATFIFCASIRLTTFGLERAAVRPPTTAGLHAVSVEEQQDGLIGVPISVSLRFFSPPAAPVLNEGVDRDVTLKPRPLFLAADATWKTCERCQVGELIPLRCVSWITSAQAMSAAFGTPLPAPSFLYVGVWDIPDCRRHHAQRSRTPPLSV
ncbi:uncharacterized protein SCHCODRAFT_02501065 [Schizophyllum commune H4-8]|nr:uncharacterized protein SCHCODRAFT_02501065 [Schizophyllum commune H4-8]KAI5893334.1 hypothetical protein SCHCODRAFT_02501065 [Schizophyllum commune H4-8]